jgi:hypothetical protein
MYFVNKLKMTNEEDVSKVQKRELFTKSVTKNLSARTFLGPSNSKEADLKRYFECYGCIKTLPLLRIILTTF